MATNCEELQQQWQPAVNHIEQSALSLVFYTLVERPILFRHRCGVWSLDNVAAVMPLVRTHSGNLTLQSLVILIHLPCLPYAPNFFGSTCRARANRQTIFIVWVLRTHGGGAMGSYSIRRRAFQPSFSICHSAQSPLFLFEKILFVVPWASGECIG